MDPRPHAVVADDDPDMAQLLADVLSRYGWRVTAVADGAALVDAVVRGAGVRLVVTDHHMPGLQGLDAIEVIAASVGVVPFVLFSGAADVPTTSRARDLGAVAVLLKPFSMDELLAAADRALTHPPPLGRSCG